MDTKIAMPALHYFQQAAARNVLPGLVFIMLMLAVSTLHAQQGNTRITGKITALQDKQPVAHATVSIDKKGVATATNISGLFALIIPDANLGDTLKISCLGFKTRHLPVKQLENGANLNIVLEKQIKELNEVKVTYYDALKIIRKAIDRIPDNYINHPHILRGFYRMYTFSDDAPLQLSEAVFDVYNYGYGDKHADLFRLIKARNDKNDRDFNLLELGQKPNSIFENDIINHRHSSGFLNDEGLNRHQFNVAGVIDFQGHSAYEIDFEENPGSTGETFRGQMLIDTKTFAFMYFSFGLSPSGSKYGGTGNFISHTLVKSGGVSIRLKQDHTEVTYQEVAHHWVLSNVSGDHVLAIKTPGAKDDLLAQVKFNYQVTGVDTVAKSSFSSKLGRNENINAHTSDLGSSFWKDYNILLSDYNTEDIFKQIQTINRLSKQKAK